MISHGWRRGQTAQTQRVDNITFYATDTSTETSLNALWPHIQDVLSTRRKTGKRRLTQPLCKHGSNALFIKTAALDSIPSRIRTTLGIRRRSGLYDWALEELNNHTEAQKRTHLVPKLLGYGLIRQRWLVEEIFLNYEHLADWEDGYEWLCRNPSQVHQLTEAGIKLILQLNQKGIHHLDLWAGNMMLREDDLTNLKAIDLENCFIGDNPHASETLGFQLAFFYQHMLSGFISETLYDRLVEQQIAASMDLQRNRFDVFYSHFKHHGADRKERHRIPKTGLWPFP